MKKFLISTLIIGLLATGGYYLYRTLMPGIIANAMVSDSIPDYIPKRLKNQVERIRRPVSKGTEAMIEEMHGADIPLNNVLNTVDGITEEQTDAFLDDIEKQSPRTSDEVFDLAKKHFPTSFDAEVFREPFVTHFDMDQIERALIYAKLNRKSKDVDLSTAKAIVKKIIIEKEKEMTKD